MSEYHFLVAGLPGISFNREEPPCTIEQFMDEVYAHLTPGDQKTIDLLLLAQDNRNLLALLKDEAAEPREQGCYTKRQLQELVSAARAGEEQMDGCPPYLFHFIKEHPNGVGEGIAAVQAENSLWGTYYHHAANSSNKFVSGWFTFNLNQNNILAAAIARKHHQNVADAVVGDNEVARALRTSAAQDFGLAADLDYAATLLQLADEQNLSERERRLDKMRWDWLEENSVYCYFSIERIFVFLQQLLISRRWAVMDEEKGTQVFRSLVNKLKGEIRIPDEFKV